MRDDTDDSLPAELVEHWGVKPKGKPQAGRWPLSEVVKAGVPDEVPEAVAYHLAVNHRRYETVRPLAGLTTETVKFVLDQARFELDGKYRAAADYLRFLAEGHWGHPLLGGFDTLVNERLLEICVEATRLYYFTIGERLDDEEARSTWASLATCFFWVGRTGAAPISRCQSATLEISTERRALDSQPGSRVGAKHARPCSPRRGLHAPDPSQWLSEERRRSPKVRPASLDRNV